MSTASPAVLRIPKARRRRSLRVPGLLTLGALVLALVLAYIGTNIYASVAQQDLEAQFERSLAEWSTLDPLARSSIAYTQGDPIARLIVPEIALDVIVAEGATPAIMRRAPGHLPGTVAPGDEGVTILTANRFGFGSFFSRLGSLSEGDHILTESALGRTTYTIAEVRTVPASRLDLSPDSSERVLVLFASSRMWGGSDRIVVRAVAEEAPKL